MDTFIFRHLTGSVVQVIGLATGRSKPNGLARIIGSDHCGDTLAPGMPCPRCDRSIRASMGPTGPEWICGCVDPVGLDDCDFEA